jgi:hypothetical protein
MAFPCFLLVGSPCVPSHSLRTFVILHSHQVEKLRVEHMDSFKSGDIDKDGQLSAPEFVAVMTPHRSSPSTQHTHALTTKPLSSPCTGFNQGFPCVLMVVFAGAIVHASNKAPAHRLRPRSLLCNA